MLGPDKVGPLLCHAVVVGRNQTTTAGERLLLVAGVPVPDSINFS